MRSALAIAVLVAACSSPAAAPDAGPGGVGDVCGGAHDPPCEDGLFCHDPDYTCGRGTCAEPVTGCDRGTPMICGCDHLAHTNVCESNADGSDIAFGGGCDAPPGTFACGQFFCDPDSQYCYGHTSDIDGNMYYFCTALPSTCLSATCDCFTGPDCAGELPPACTDTGNGLIVVCGPD